MVKQVLQEIDLPYLFVTADSVPPENTAWIGETWSTARARLQIAQASEYLLVIDEVHKIDNWSEAVKKEWDMDTFNDVPIKVVLLGSSRLLLKDGLTESLAGRFEIIRMSHWSYLEMREAFGFDINQYVYYGGYPGGAYSGKELSLNKMLGQLLDAGNVTTLANYLTTLDESRLLCGLHKYANDAARKYNSVPKLMVYNTALLSAQSGVAFEKAFTTPTEWGRWVESAVGAFLLNQADEVGYKMYYWRERNDEVDFIIEYNRKCVAIEVKSGRRTDNEGLKKFREQFNPAHSFIVGSGGIPVEEFLTFNLERLF